MRVYKKAKKMNYRTQRKHLRLKPLHHVQTQHPLLQLPQYHKRAGQAGRARIPHGLYL